MSLKNIWAELEHILGIAVAVAPVVAVADPNAASSIASAEAAINLASPLVGNIIKTANGPQTPEQIGAQAQNIVNTAVAIGQATGKITTEKAAQIKAITPAIVATAVAASKPVTPVQ
ncbi:MAG TPA: hypothetical protein VFM18_23450 [Methanosarcina sp.]|nr:hypothetical protein [Methanosarcina sp.]